MPVYIVKSDPRIKPRQRHGPEPPKKLRIKWNSPFVPTLNNMFIDENNDENASYGCDDGYYSRSDGGHDNNSRGYDRNDDYSGYDNSARGDHGRYNDYTSSYDNQNNEYSGSDSYQNSSYNGYSSEEQSGYQADDQKDSNQDTSPEESSDSGIDVHVPTGPSQW